MNTEPYRTKYIWLPAILIAGCGAWMVAGYANIPTEREPMHLSATGLSATSAPAQPPATSTTDTTQTGSSPTEASAFTSASADANAAVEAAPLDGLTIASQSWRRGGLGSKALVTFTLRNANDYAVKDIELACSFSRSDGSHLTDRRRMIHDVVNMRSRKTFARLHVGFVNINADQAKCTLVAASPA